MLAKDNRMKVLQVFFDNPIPKGGFQLREISRIINLAPKSVKKYLEELEKEKIIIQQKQRVQGYPTYFANRESEYFKILKKQFTIVNLYESKIIEFIQEQCLPSAIILFGSAVRGEDIKESDIDLFVLAKEKVLNIKKYELFLKRKINLFFAEDFSKLSKELRNNIINGYIIYGYLKVL